MALTPVPPHRGDRKADHETDAIEGALEALAADSGVESVDFPAVFEQMAKFDTRGLLLVGPTRQVYFINAAGREIIGYSGPLPAHISQVLSDAHVAFAVGDAFHDRRPAAIEVYVPAPDRLLSVRVIPVLGDTGEPVLAVASIEDVTRLRHLETVRRDFVANVSHELRTPLASINLLIETLQNGALEDTATAAHFLNRIEVEAQSMARLVEELLELSRLEAGSLAMKPEPTNVRELLEGVANRLTPSARDKELEVAVDVQDALPPILIDPERIEQVLMNLVHNAIKFTPNGGNVWLRARRRGPGVEVEVVESGIGMDAAVAARVSERFYKADRVRTRQGSSGLGLAIARHLLELHGSQLQVVSEPHRGSRFFFELPVATPS